MGFCAGFGEVCGGASWGDDIVEIEPKFLIEVCIAPQFIHTNSPLELNSLARTSGNSISSSIISLRINTAGPILPIRVKLIDRILKIRHRSIIGDLDLLIVGNLEGHGVNTVNL